MTDLPFSSEHKARFQELRDTGELHAIDREDYNEHTDFRPWCVEADVSDSGTADRLRARFCIAVKNAAIAAGAPYRINRLSWWISKLARGKPLPFIEDLIQRSAELCEELEAKGLELGGAPPRPEGAGGLYRDRYPCEWGEPYFLYDGSPRSFSDPRTEFDYWTEHIWKGFNEHIAKLDKMGGARKRQDGETWTEFNEHIRKRVNFLYKSMKGSIRGMSYDLAVLQANYIIDRGLRGNAGIRAFQAESATLAESLTVFWQENSRCLGLSWIKQEKTGVDLGAPFREVGEDFRHLILPGRLRLQNAVSRGDEEGRPCGPQHKPTRRNRKNEAIDKELQRLAETLPKSHREVFHGLDGRIHIPNAEPFASASGWLAGYRRNPATASAWLSKAWSRLDLPPFPRGPKK